MWRADGLTMALGEPKPPPAGRGLHRPPLAI